MSIIEFLEYYSDHIKVREATKQGYAVAMVGDSVNLEQPNSKTRRGRVGKGYANTLTCGCNQGVVVKEDKMQQIITVGNYSPSNHNASRIVSTEGLAPTVMENHGTVTAILNNKLKEENRSMWRNELEKFEFKMDEVRIFDIFAGIGSLHKSLKRLGVPARVTNLSEVDIDAIISYSGVHIDNFKDVEFSYPPDEYMKEWLIERNIGFDFEKGKSKIPRLNKDKLKLLYRGSYMLKNLGDVSQINPDEIEDFDLMNLSFCCQDLSNAGKQKGLRNEDGTPTRSGLIVPSLKLARAKKPKYIMIENVKALIQNKFIDDFYSIITELEDMGYKCYYPTKEDKKKGKVPTCLNSKNYGIPQNRERIFVFAIRRDVDNGMEFNYGFDSGVRLKHILEDYVDEKYYLSDEIQKRFTPFPNNRMCGEDLEVIGTTSPNPYNNKGDLIFDKCTSNWVYNKDKLISTLAARDYKQPKQIMDNSIDRIGGLFDTETRQREVGAIFNQEGISPCLNTMQGGYRQPNIIDDKYYISKAQNMQMKGNYIQYDNSGKEYNSQASRLHYTDSFMGTLPHRNAGDKTQIINKDKTELNTEEINGKDYNSSCNFKIRKLTPLECWRLQGFDDEDFYKAKELGISDSQLYKQAGNSITVNTMYFQFKNLFKQYIAKQTN